jgi:hypothetical protein
MGVFFFLFGFRVKKNVLIVHQLQHFPWTLKRKHKKHLKERERERKLKINKWKKQKTKGASQYGLANYIKKKFKAKEELWKLKYFTMQKYNLQKQPLNETKILQDIIYNSITNLKFQH